MKGSHVLSLAVLWSCASAPEVQFGETRAVSAVTDVGTAPMFAVSPAGEEAIAWVSAPQGGTDGRLYIAVGDRAPVEIRDALGPIEVHGESPPKLAYGADGSLNAIYVVPKLVPGERFPASALRFIRSTDDGRTWSGAVTVTDDDEFGSHNFHSLHAAADDALYVSWLDGRNGMSTVYVTRSTDGGASWEANRRVVEGEACPCCRTALASAADGSLYVAWRSVLPGDVRDIVISRSRDGAQSWSAPVRVHADDWVFPGCPHAGPALQVDEQGRVHVAWWTGKEGSAGVYYARSDDGAQTFGRPVALGTAERSQPAHVQLAMDARGLVMVAWDDGTMRVPQVVLRTSGDGGTSFGPRIEVSASGLVAAFPVLALQGDSVTVAWSEQTPDAAQRAAAARPDMSDPAATKGLTAVGDASVVVRRGVIRMVP